MSTVPLLIDDGVLMFDKTRERLVDPILWSWLEELLPEELLVGVVRLEVPVEVDWLPDGSPRLQVIDQKETP